MTAQAQRPALTPAQSAVHLELRRGRSNKQIAAALGTSEGYVENLMGQILVRLGAENRTQAALTDPAQLPA